jgi:hypothetical protein
MVMQAQLLTPEHPSCWKEQAPLGPPLARRSGCTILPHKKSTHGEVSALQTYAEGLGLLEYMPFISRLILRSFNGLPVVAPKQNAQLSQQELIIHQRCS